MLALKESICCYDRDIQPYLLHSTIENMVWGLQSIIDSEDGHIESIYIINITQRNIFI